MDVKVAYLFRGFVMVAITFEQLELGREFLVEALGTGEVVIHLFSGTAVTVFTSGVRCLCALPGPCHWLGRRAINGCGVGLRSGVRIRHVSI